MTDTTRRPASYKRTTFEQPVAPGMAERTGERTGESRISLLAGRLLFGTLILVLAFSPFEAGYPPLGRFMWATFTNLEACLFLLAAAWLFRLSATTSARKRLLNLPLLLPILGLVAAAFISTAFGEFKSLGVHFIYRLLMGVLVYASAWETLRGERRLLAALATFVGAAFVSAVIGLLEFAPWINLQPWLRAFKPQPTTVGGMLRLSGSFEYANGAAIYFEMALPVVIGLLAIFSSRRMVNEIFSVRGLSETLRRVVQVALLVAAGTLTMALALTFSRAAWAGIIVAVGVIGMAGLLRKRTGSGISGQEATAGRQWVVKSILRSVAASVAVMALGAIYVAVSQPLLMLRLTSGENDRTWYKNSIRPGPVPPLSAGEIVTVPVTLRNEGPMTWQAERAPVVNLSYHWKNAGLGANSDFYAVFEGARTPLPNDVPPGGSVTVEAVLQAPLMPGDYLLEWDMVQERVAWFYEKTRVRDEPTLYNVVGIVGAGVAAQPPPASITPSPVSVELVENSDTSTVSRRQLWAAALAMFRDYPITGVGPDGFRNLYGKYAGVTRWSKNIYTNNTYIEMFTNLGAIGGFAFLLLAALAIGRSVRNILREPVGAVWAVCLGMTASLVAFYFHGFVDYFLFATPIYIIFWFSMAVSVFWPRLVGNNEPVGAMAEQG